MADLQQLIKNIEQWAEDRNLIEGSTPQKQFIKLMEEFGELCAGISKNNIDKIFGKYVRLNDERSIIKEGTGIGLSLVKSLVKLHDGEVTVDSEIGKWTEFNIKIPNRTSIKESIDTYEKDLDRVEKIRIEFSDIYA